jgi:glycosyltransferase involved in cell wall biosynthesis
MKGISVLTVVYQEQERVGSFVDNFLWTQDVVIIDKSSTDRTVEIAREHGARCFVVPYVDNIPPEMNSVASQCKNDWVFMVTASDIIHPKLVEELLALINKPGFDYDIIEYPFVNHVFGLESTHSPWDVRHRNRLFRRSSVEFNDSVHREVTYKSQRTYRMKFDSVHAIHHLTHETLETFFERHHRYAKLEVERFKSKKPSTALFMTSALLIRSILRVIFRKQSFLMGWNGLALSMAYVSYFMFIFLYTWQHFLGKGEANYVKLREEYGKIWRSHELSSRKETQRLQTDSKV